MPVAMYSYVCKYWKKMDPAVFKDTMDHWTERNKRWLDGDHTPKRISALYCQNVDCSMETVTDQLDWNFFDIPDDKSGPDQA